LKNSNYSAYANTSGIYSGFSDVPSNHWAAPAIAIGGYSGTGGGLFSPDKTLSYSEALTILVKQVNPIGLASFDYLGWPHNISQYVKLFYPTVALYTASAPISRDTYAKYITYIAKDLYTKTYDVKTILTYDLLGAPYYAYTVGGKVIKDVVAKEVEVYKISNEYRSIEWNLKNDKITTPKGGFPIYLNGQVVDKKSSLSSFISTVTDLESSAKATNTDLISFEYKIYIEDGQIVSASLVTKELVKIYAYNKKFDIVTYGKGYTAPASLFPDLENKGTEYYIVTKNNISYYDKELKYGYNSTILAAEKAEYFVGTFDYSIYDSKYDIITLDLGKRLGIVYFGLTKAQSAEVKTYTNRDKVEIVVLNNDIIYLKNLSK
jgi:hypothetical protein